MTRDDLDILRRLLAHPKCDPQVRFRILLPFPWEWELKEWREQPDARLWEEILPSLEGFLAASGMLGCLSEAVGHDRDQLLAAVARHTTPDRIPAVGVAAALLEAWDAPPPTPAEPPKSGGVPCG